MYLFTYDKCHLKLIFIYFSILNAQNASLRRVCLQVICNLQVHTEHKRRVSSVCHIRFYFKHFIFCYAIYMRSITMTKVFFLDNEELRVLCFICTSDIDHTYTNANRKTYTIHVLMTTMKHTPYMY
jgi:hypothetical protein